MALCQVVKGDLGLIQAPTEECPGGTDGGGGVSMLTPCCSQAGSQPCPRRRRCWSSGSTSRLRPKSSCCSPALLFSAKGQAFVQPSCSSEHSGQSQFSHQRLREKTHSPSPQILLQMALSLAGAAQGPQDSFYCLPGLCFPPPSFSPPLCLAVCALYTWCTHHIPWVHVCLCVYMYA